MRGARGLAHGSSAGRCTEQQGAEHGLRPPPALARRPRYLPAALGGRAAARDAALRERDRAERLVRSRLLATRGTPAPAVACRRARP